MMRADIAHMKAAMLAPEHEVRRPPRWPRSWADASLFSPHSPTGMHGPTRRFWANLTPLSLQEQAEQEGGYPETAAALSLLEQREQEGAGAGEELSFEDLLDEMKVRAITVAPLHMENQCRSRC